MPAVVRRLTFEAVLANQNALRQKIGELINENRALNSSEREEFQRVYYRATLGKGAIATPNTNLPGIRDATLDDLVFNHLAVHELGGIRVGWVGTDERRKLSPARVWQLVLARLNTDVFGAALQQALASPERALLNKELRRSR